ncbi:MAG: histone deacetylase family protein [Deltaproteobacteria bacterium]|nr:histone deacetylase family protein [Deltaproteobacteria bacterium]MBW2119357.1 histone deacetylase family protein [Deltaproteobacteria bacterium]MBW2345861.1 histone deacetylase family protein [Deltaproteobacteria bacterium]
MKIIFHDDYKNSSYASDTAAAEGRMESIMDLLSKERGYPILKPVAAGIEDLLRAHTSEHIDRIRQDENLFRMALLSAGGAISAVEIAFDGEPAFACIRPPGHHASRDSRWGFCYFNNMGVALLKLRSKGRIKGAFVLDFDAHTGDGNIDVLSEYPEIKILNPFADDRNAYIEKIEKTLNKIKGIDIIAASAGFDSYEKDLGKKLKRFDFYLIGRLLKKFSKRLCNGRRFAILEGGYYLKDLGKNVLAFCQGFAD